MDLDPPASALASQPLLSQALGTGNPVAPDTTPGRGSRHQRGRAGSSRGRRADNGGVISNRRQGRPQQGQEGSGEDQAGNGAGTSSTSRGGPRPGRGRAGRTLPARVPPARRFGGQLTANDSGGASSAPGVTLQADAQEFYPGQPHTQRRGPSGGGSTRKQIPTRGEPSTSRVPRARRGSKSSAPDIATRTHEDIANGIYECAICTSELGRHSKIWSCKTCWMVFHLSCIKKWSNNAGSTQQNAQQPQDEESPARKWRCPGCNLPKDLLPTNYFCWCEKEIDPRPTFGTPPHSCGQTCGKPRVFPRKCPHPCELLCHAGPCLPCTHLGPAQSCFCGKESTTRRCADTNYESGWSCKRICGESMPCGKHTCQRECHDGRCGACEAVVNGRCYCGKLTKAIICCETEEEKESQLVEVGHGGDRPTTNWTGIFQCNEICGRAFDCGKHFCVKECHPQDADPAHCPRSPNIITVCPCGKTPLMEISDMPRRSCLDPIPNCKKECHKPLACGHPCQQVCHSGSCAPCLQTILISCRCGRTSSPTVCHQGILEPPQCVRICKATLNCGRHECGERCCPCEQKSRASARKKTRPLGSAPRATDEGFEAEHICTRVCGRVLKCGNHPCPELCHKGPCSSCRDAIFDEISCNCGRTVLQPPLPCGTKQPPCRYNCERPKDCGHPQVVHNCHGNDEPCPNCPFLIEKSCMCGKKNLKNQQCWLSDVRCGELCGRKLRCGSHYCGKPCHRPGYCEDTGKACQQVCGKAKKACGHPCEEQCHAPYPCPEAKPCTHKAIITCECQHLKQELKCNASKTGEGNSNKSLKCDSECARLERNRKLALALNIDQETHRDDHIPYSSETLEIFQEIPNWAQVQERVFRIFAADENEKRLRFKPMPQRQRAFIHALADDFGLDSESMDPEPHRHVAVFKTPRFVSAPMKALAECVRVRSESSNSTNESKRGFSSTGTDNIPSNGLLLTSPRFGLTVAELQKVFSPCFDTHSSRTTFSIIFLPSEEIVIKPSSPLPLTSLTALKQALTSIATPLAIAKSVQLCTVDSSFNIVRREADASGGEGWSHVAAKAAAPKSWRPASERMVGVKSTFMILGSTATVKGKGKKVGGGVVAEDWEQEEEKEEEKERGGGDTILGGEGE